MKKKKRIAAAATVITVMLLLTVYLGLAVYYRGGFSLNTWINGVYCTGKTVEEVNQELLEQIQAPEIVITDRDGKEYTLFLAEADFEEDYLIPLQEYLQQQNALLWIDNVITHRSHTLTANVTYSKEKLAAQWATLDFVKEDRQKEQELSIVLTEEGYQLYNGMSGRLNEEKALEVIYDAVENRRNQVNLAEAGVYEDAELNTAQKKLLELWEKVAEFQDCHIIYDMGAEKIPVDASVACQFFMLDEDGFVQDENGNLVADEEKIKDFINQLAEEYNTYGKEREFTATRGDVVTIPGKGTYGTELDVQAEYKYLIQAFTEKRREVHVPTYKKEAFFRGKNDIGDTYIEIDMTEQKMYYYQDGEQLLETDVVTGNIRRRMGTPEGVNYVYGKQKNRVLRGPGYASPVEFWMPVKGNIGIHDANWREEFGGEIYKTNGSHGCINTPTEKISELYDMVEIGTPVIMFY